MRMKFGRILSNLYSLKSKIIIHLIVFTIIPVFLVMIFVYAMMHNQIRKDYEADIRSKLNDCADSINKQFLLYISSSRRIPINSYVAAGIKSYLEDDPQGMVDFQGIMSLLTWDLNYFHSDIRAFSFYLGKYDGAQGQYVESIQGSEKESFIQYVLQAPIDKEVWAPQLTEDKNGRRYFTFYRNITSYINHEAVLQINIPYENVSQYLDLMKNNIDRSIRVVFINSHGLKCYDSGGMESSYFIVKNKKELLDGSTITAAIPKWINRGRDAAVLLYMALIFLAVIVFVAAASNITSAKMTRKLNSFINYLKDNNEMLLSGKLAFADSPSTVDDRDEISIINQKFLAILNRMNETYRSMIKMEAANNMLMIDLLQARINPHLLYNSLSVIRWSALRKKDEKTVEIVDAMTNYYRIALNKGSNIVEVEVELDMIREYVRIINFTHSCKYELCICVEDVRLLKSHIIKHLLQPIVENAILHGLNGKEGDGKVIIHGTLEEDRIEFEVIDNGYGMDPDTLDRVRKMQCVSSYGGYGIRNLANRIRMLYGDDCGLDIDSSSGAGTRVRVHIKPMTREHLEKILSYSIN